MCCRINISTYGVNREWLQADGYIPQQSRKTKRAYYHWFCLVHKPEECHGWVAKGVCDGVCDGKIPLTLIGYFNQRKRTREVSSNPDSPLHTVKTFTKVGASDYETKGCVLRSGNHTPCAEPTGSRTDTAILINDEFSRLKLPRHSLHLPLHTPPNFHIEKSAAKSFFLFLSFSSITFSIYFLYCCQNVC